MNFKYLSFALLFALFSFSLSAQESEGGTPLSFIRIHELPPNIPVMEMPYVDVPALLAEDSLNANKQQPYRFGYNHYVFTTPENSGEWKTLKHGERVWRLGIKCPDALSINIAFAKFIIPDGAKLFIYNKNHSYTLGAFTSKNMQPDGQFGVDIVPGEEIIVEYNEPANAAFHGQLNIFRITHAYRDLFKIAKAFGSSGNCHNNVICPVGNPWANEIKSVAMITVNGNGICSGALINNANQDGTPYFLTAHHCTGGGTSTWVFRFNYNSPTCTPSANGTLNQTISGSTVKAEATSLSGSDFALLLLNSTPPPSYNVCYAGWSRSNVPPTSGACIHHPSGDVKKISFSTTPFDSSSWQGSTLNHWNVTWSSGVTEGGSSGSPMFDQNHRLVGQLHGGPSACGASQGNLNDDYGKLFYSWDKNGNTPATRIKDWLDPNNTGLMNIDTYCPNQVLNNAVAQNLLLPSNGLCDTFFIPSLVVNNAGTQTITSLTITWSLDGGPTQTDTLNNLSIISNATATVFLPQLNYLAGSHSYTVTITLVNGQTDAITNNNTSSGNFISSSGIAYSLTLTTDDYGDETGFDVINANGDTVFSIAQGTLTSNTTQTYNFCLPDGCYTFIASDSIGDGMCCNAGNGSFLLTDNNNFTIASGAQFGFSQSFPFCTTLNTNDAAIDTILTPNGTQCISAVVPKIIIRNQGQSLLTQLSIGYLLNGVPQGNYLWSGSLAYNQTDTAIIGLFTVSPDPNILTIYTYDPNGQADENTSNDTLSSSFIFSQGSTVTLSLLTDSFPNETTWAVVNANNNSIVYQSPQTNHPYTPNSNNKIDFCLPNGCYKFIITDTQNNGICCNRGNGSYTLLAPNNSTMAVGGQFNNADTALFCLPFVGVTENLASTVKVFPNPATGNLYIVFGEVVKESFIVEMFNAQGQLVQTTPLQNANMAGINVASLPSGFYILRIYGEKVKPFATSVIVKN